MNVIYRTNELEKINVKKFNAEEIRDHYTHLYLIYRLEADILRDNLIKDILKELSPYLRYLESELEELEEMEKLNEKSDNDSDDNSDNDSDNDSNSDKEKFKELLEIQ